MKVDKKNLEIKGVLLYPIQIGRPALIQEGGNLRRTSIVLSLESISPNEIWFETKNTKYLLHLISNNLQETKVGMV